VPRTASRLLSLLELLQAHGRLNGTDAARRIGVDVRTIRRYVASLEDMGIPITAERGRHGAYLLMPGFKLPPLMFTEEEALAVALGLVAGRGLGLTGAEAAVASARAKLERVMPERLRDRVRAIGDTVALELSRPAPAGDGAALLALTRAAQTHRRVRLRYRAANGEETLRAFDAYGVAHRSGRWYAVGRCHLARGVRSFRLDRVLSVEPLATPFDRPAAFDVLRHLTYSVASLPRAFSIEVLLRADLAAARRETFGALGVLEPAAGGVLLRAEADDLAWFARELGRLPFSFEVRRPAALRAELARCARRLRRAAGKSGLPRPSLPRARRARQRG
jgi:predicted DNA-binding transcriptional regulator YafY